MADLIGQQELAVVVQQLVAHARGTVVGRVVLHAREHLRAHAGTCQDAELAQESTCKISCAHMPAHSSLSCTKKQARERFVHTHAHRSPFRHLEQAKQRQKWASLQIRACTLQLLRLETRCGHVQAMQNQFGLIIQGRCNLPRWPVISNSWHSGQRLAHKKQEND